MIHEPFYEASSRTRENVSRARGTVSVSRGGSGAGTHGNVRIYYKGGLELDPHPVTKHTPYSRIYAAYGSRTVYGRGSRRRACRLAGRSRAEAARMLIVPICDTERYAP